MIIDFGYEDLLLSCLMNMKDLRRYDRSTALVVAANADVTGRVKFYSCIRSAYF